MLETSLGGNPNSKGKISASGLRADRNDTKEVKKMQATELGNAQRAGECTICHEVITQPICVACLADQMEAWLREAKPELAQEVQQRADELWIPRGEMECVQCNTPMDVCAYCFTNYVLNWLGKHPELVPEFMMYFNFDLHYHGYGKELLELV